MKISVLPCAILTAITFATTGPATAATININTVSGSTFEATTGIGDTTSTSGADLVGSRMVASYADGTQETLVFGQIGNTRWGARGSDLGVRFTGGPFRLTADKMLTTLLFDLTPSASVFDIIDTRGTTGGISTPGTSFGNPFRITSDHTGLDGQVNVTYTGGVNIAGSPVVGDLFSRMLIDYSGLSSGGFIGAMTIDGDTDVLADGASLSRVPLPGSLPALLLGLAAFGLISRRKKQIIA